LKHLVLVTVTLCLLIISCLASDEATASESPGKNQVTDASGSNYSQNRLEKPDPEYFKRLKTSPKQKKHTIKKDWTFKETCLYTLKIIGKTIGIIIVTPIMLAILFFTSGGQVSY